MALRLNPTAGLSDRQAAEQAGRSRQGPTLFDRVVAFRVAYGFLLPALVLVTLFMVMPLLHSILMSFHDWNGINKADYTGTENYDRLFSDRRFLGALKNNGIFLIGFTSFTIILGFLLAVAIARRMVGWRFYRFAFFIPFMLVTAVIAVLWGQIYEPSHGVLNETLRAIGLGHFTQLWLGNHHITMYSIIAIAVWQISGFTMLLYLTAIESIDPAIQDAATLDGVNAWQRCIYIIEPMVRRVTLVLVMLQIIASLKTFDLIWVLTKGGPFYASETMGTFLYRAAFEQQEFGYASAVAIVMTVIVMAVTGVFLIFSRLSHQER